MAGHADGMQQQLSDERRQTKPGADLSAVNGKAAAVGGNPSSQVASASPVLANRRSQSRTLARPNS